MRAGFVAAAMAVVCLAETPVAPAAPGNAEFSAPVYEIREPLEGEVVLAIPVLRVGGSEGRARVMACLGPASGESTAICDLPRIERIGPWANYLNDPYWLSQEIIWEDGDDTPKEALFTIPADFRFDLTRYSTTTKRIQVPDPQIEGTETLRLSLAYRAGQIGFGANKTAVLKILDAQAPPEGVLGFTRTRFTAYNDAGVAVARVQRTGGSRGRVSVRVEIDGDVGKEKVSFTAPDTILRKGVAGVDFRPVSTVLVWDDGEEGEKCVPVPIMRKQNFQLEARLCSPRSEVTLARNVQEAPNGRLSGPASGEGTRNPALARDRSKAHYWVMFGSSSEGVSRGVVLARDLRKAQVVVYQAKTTTGTYMFTGTLGPRETSWLCKQREAKGYINGSRPIRGIETHDTNFPFFAQLSRELDLVNVELNIATDCSELLVADWLAAMAFAAQRPELVNAVGSGIGSCFECGFGTIVPALLGCEQSIGGMASALQLMGPVTGGDHYMGDYYFPQLITDGMDDPNGFDEDSYHFSQANIEWGKTVAAIGQPGCGHGLSTQRERLATVYIWENAKSRIGNRHCGEGRGDFVRFPGPRKEDGWSLQAQHPDLAILDPLMAPYSSFTGDPSRASWLLNETVARYARATSADSGYHYKNKPGQLTEPHNTPAQFLEMESLEAEAGGDATLNLIWREPSITITRVDLYHGADLITSVSSLPCSITLTNLTPGVHAVTADLTASDGRKFYGATAFLAQTYAHNPTVFPTGLKADTSAGGVALSWTFTPDASVDGLRVERRLASAPDTWAALADLPPDSAEYSDATGSAGQTYRYRVCAFNAWRISRFTNEVEVTYADTTPPVIVSQPVDAEAALGGAAAFVVEATGAPGLSYQWKKNGTNIAGKTQPYLIYTSIAAGTVGEYSVEVSNAFGSVESRRARLTVRPATPSITPPGGTFASHADIVLGAEAETTIWYTVNGAEPRPGAGQSAAPGAALTLHRPGNYEVQAIAVNSNGIVSQIAASTFTVLKSSPAPLETLARWHFDIDHYTSYVNPMPAHERHAAVAQARLRVDRGEFYDNNRPEYYILCSSTMPTADPEKYISLMLHPAPGQRLIARRLVLGFSYTYHTVEVRSSLDGFKRPMATAVLAGTDPETCTLDLPAIESTYALELRLYFFNPTDGATRLFIRLLGDCAIEGVVSPLGPIGAPENLQATAAAGSVQLTWNASAHPGCAGYNLYRAPAVGGPYAKLNAAPIAGVSYVDAPVADPAAWFYALTAVEDTGLESVFSPPAQAD